MAMSLLARPHTYTLSPTKAHTFPLCVLSVGCLLAINIKSHLLVKLCRGLSFWNVQHWHLLPCVAVFDQYSWDFANTGQLDKNVGLIKGKSYGLKVRPKELNQFAKHQVYFFLLSLWFLHCAWNPGRKLFTFPSYCCSINLLFMQSLKL